MTIYADVRKHATEISKNGTAVNENIQVRQIDQHVGRKIRDRRILLGYTQQQMANLIGVTYQQAHKYERGINRISAGRLYSIACALNIPISYFFEGLGMPDAEETSPRQRMCLEMARNFSHIENERHQDALSHLARALSESSTD